MTAHDPAFQWPEQARPPHFVAASTLVRPLTLLTILTGAVAAGLFVLSRPIGARWFPAVHLPDLGLAVGSLLLAALGLVACLGMVMARRRDMTSRQGDVSSTSARSIAGWPQTITALLFTIGAAWVVLANWPLRQTVAEALAGSGGFTTASILLLLATPWLLAERYVTAIAPERLPEGDDLRTLLCLPVGFLGIEAVLLIASSLGFGSLYWIHEALSVLLLLICIELALRVLATWFLPPPESIAARATIGSFLAGLLRGRALSPASMASTVRSQFGMDFSRSWALHFMRATAVPVVLLMLAFCWFLTGVTRIDLNERGAYERLGSADAILKPGLHLVLPWPFGVVRHLEFDVMHAALVSYGDQGLGKNVADKSTAEGNAPAEANKLWDSEQPTDVSYLIASSEQNRQSFQTVSISVRVLYRIGLTDTAARAALYHEADPDGLVHSVTGRLLAQFFASQTLPSVLGENQGIIAEDIRTQLRQALDQLGSGVDIVAVTIEAIHPPAGAASAYRNVQAAEIAATTSIATEQGRAQTTQSIAQRDAHNATNDAAALAAETVSAAQVDLTNITADVRPYRAASQPFLLERYFSDVKAALENVPLEIVDHRLSGASLPTIDLRPPGAPHDPSERRPTQEETTR